MIELNVDLSHATWRKSAYSGQSGNCIEVAAVPTVWRKSTRSNQSGACIEVAAIPAWRKSTRSNQSGNCVEVADVWRKSARSSQSGNCVEVAEAARAVAVRDSKNPSGPALAFTPRQWRAFTRTLTAASPANP